MADAKPKLLVIEDEPTIRRLIEREMRRDGYDVTAVDSHARAAPLVAGEKFDAIISDIDTPLTGSGIAFGEDLRKGGTPNADTPIHYFAGGHTADEIAHISDSDLTLKPDFSKVKQKLQAKVPGQSKGGRTP